MNEELTEKEKDFMKMLLNIGRIIVNKSDGYFDCLGLNFGSADLYHLSDKLGIDYYDL